MTTKANEVKAEANRLETTRLLCRKDAAREAVILYNYGKQPVSIFFDGAEVPSFDISPGGYWEGNGILAKSQISTNLIDGSVHCTVFCP